MICCTLFLPQGLQAESKKSMDSQAFRAVSMTLAITGINNPVSQLQNLAAGEGAALRGPGQRTGFTHTGKRSSLSSSAKRDSFDWNCADSGDTSPAALPGLPPLPGTFSLCAKALFSFCVLPPESHGHIHWSALAPPSSHNA